jgi:hypothetical protein
MGPEKRLNSYIRQVRSEPFHWGGHDCLTFSNTAFKIYHGFGYADDWLGRYLVGDKPMSKTKMQTEFSAGSFDEAVGRVLQEVQHVPPRGALVATRKIKRFATGYARLAFA